jgi:hypothetical protein
VPRPCPICQLPEAAAKVDALREAGVPMREILTRVTGFNRDKINRHFRHSKEQTSLPDTLDPLALSDAELETWRQRNEAAFLVASAQGDTKNVIETTKLGTRLALEKRERLLRHQQQQTVATNASSGKKPTFETWDAALRAARALRQKKIDQGWLLCPVCSSNLVLPQELRAVLPAILEAAAKLPDVFPTPHTTSETVEVQSANSNAVQC